MIQRAAKANRPNWRLLAHVAIVEVAVLISVSLFDADTQLIIFLMFVRPALLLASIIFIILLFRAAYFRGGPLHDRPVIFWDLVCIWAMISCRQLVALLLLPALITEPARASIFASPRAHRPLLNRSKNKPSPWRW